MRILHVCPSRSFSGLEQYALNLAIRQKQDSHDVSFVCHPGMELYHKCMEAKIPVLTFNAYSALSYILFWKKLISWLLSQKAGNRNIIHLHSTQELPHVFPVVFWFKLFKVKIPKVILQTHIWIDHYKKDLWHKCIYSVTDIIIASSEVARQKLIACLPVDPKKITVSRYGRPLQKIKSELLSKAHAQKDLGLPGAGNYKVFGVISRIEKSKGIEEFLRAFLKVFNAKRETLEIFAVIMGGPSPKDVRAEAYFKNIKTWLAEQSADFQNHVIMTGQRLNAHRYLKAFDLYVLPSYLETFSLAMLDAQLAELPIVGSNAGGTPDVVIEGQTGWLFKAQKADDLALTLTKALENESLWKEMGLRASARVAKDFDEEIVIKKIDLVYSQS